METLSQFTVKRLSGDIKSVYSEMVGYTESVYSENVRWRHWFNLQWKCEIEIVGQFTAEM